ncbi:MAG: hypothetical protein JSW33_05350 [bacterium]|nr:MAG: hypothetical protein JSW33_05350 [bacterium]
MTPVIYLVESQQKLSQAIVNIAIENGYEIFIFKKFSDLLIDVRKHRPDAIFINKRLLPESYDEFLEIKGYYIIIYGNQFDLDERLNYYNMGVERLLDKEYFSPLALVQLLKKRQTFLQKNQNTPRGDLIHSSLRDMSLIDILDKAVREKKSFALKIYDNGWHGSMRVIKGNVNHVSCMEKSGSQALLDILHHPRGQIFLKYFTGLTGTSKADFSTLGVLLEYKYQQHLLEEFEQELGTINPVIYTKSITGTPEEIQKNDHIISLINQKLTLRKIIQASPFPFNHTFKTLQSWFRKGLIDVDRDTMAQGKFTQEEIERLFEQILPSKQRMGQVLVLGTTDESKKNMIQGFAKCFGRPVMSEGSVDLCEISSHNISSLSILGVSLDKYLTGKIGNSLSNLVATLLIFDFSQRLTFDYKKYFIRQYLTEKSVPLIIGILNLSRLHETAIAEFRRLLEIPAEIPVIALDVQKISDLRELLNQLLKLVAREKKLR